MKLNLKDIMKSFYMSKLNSFVPNIFLGGMDMFVVVDETECYSLLSIREQIL